MKPQTKVSLIIIWKSGRLIGAEGAGPLATNCRTGAVMYGERAGIFAAAEVQCGGGGGLEGGCACCTA